MDSKKKIALDEVNRALLLMKYDTKKTLTENVEKIIIKEQTSSNIVTDNDLMGSTNIFRSYVQAAWGDYNIFDVLGFNQIDVLAGRRIGVKGVVDALDGFVDSNDLAYVLSIVAGLKGKCYEDDTQTPPIKVPAINRFLELYSEDEGGDDLISDVEGVGTRTLPTGSEKIKTKIISLINELRNQACDEVLPKPEGCPAGQVKDANGKCVKKGGGGGGSYRDCSGTYTQGCKSEVIKKVQGCLGGLVADGKFGLNTQKSLKMAGYPDGFKDSDVDKICGVTPAPDPNSTKPIEYDVYRSTDIK